MIEVTNKIVIFLDILGFSNLTLENEIDLISIKRNHGTLDKRFGNLFQKKANRLTEVFSSFHNTLESGLSLARLSCHFTSITFSDSAFIATNRLENAVSIISNLMCSFLRNGVPVRAGIASGTFETIRFKSDITSDSIEHASHFLGTGVVKACQSESCGVKGMRILLHPSIEELCAKTSTGSGILIQECDLIESNNQIGVAKEINYWDFNITDEKMAWKIFQKMWKEAPANSNGHYVATANAIKKMRIARGFPSIKDLRKVSISRKY